MTYQVFLSQMRPFNTRIEAETFAMLGSKSETCEVFVQSVDEQGKVSVVSAFLRGVEVERGYI